MKRNVKTWAAAGLASLPLLFAGCTDKEDIYDPNYGKGELKPESEYFDFATRGDVKLSLSYGKEGAYCPFEIYDVNPMVEEGPSLVKRADVKPVYAGFMNAEGEVNESMYIAKATSKVWIYTSAALLPRCEEVAINNATVAYLNETSRTVMTRATGDEFGKGEVANPYKKNMSEVSKNFANKNVWVLTEYGKYGDPTTEGFITMSGFDELAALKNRVNTALPEGNREKALEYRVENPNIKVKEDANLNLTFLGETTGTMNAFGYYYYKAGTQPNLDAIPKYMIFPNTSQKGNGPFNGRPYDSEVAPLYSGATVKLQFFGDDYAAAASYDFPAGYVIGWFVIPNAYPGYKYIWNEYNGGGWDYEYDWRSGLGYSDIKASDELCSYFISVLDAQSGKTVIGVEDSGFGSGDDDYNDMLFFVESNPAGSIIDPDTPIITFEDTEISYPYSGTYAFEDIWPDGGDYDMNDVVVEYDATITKKLHIMSEDGQEQSRKEYFSKLELSYSFVHDGATYNNAFGFQLDGVSKDAVQGELAWETGNTAHPSMIVCSNVKNAQESVKTVTVEFGENEVTTFSAKQINPFIVVNGDGTAADRTEVHLPKYRPTALAAPLGEGNINQYYIEGREGNYPFAIDIPVKGFEVVTETVAIDKEYTDFSKWVESNGTSYTDWYLNKQK